jgi:phosphate starvation-inducible PhoH-like protein
MTSEDVVRHKLVSEIVEAYERFDAEQPLERVSARNRGRR